VKKDKTLDSQRMLSVLQDLLIATLAIGGVQQVEIRKIVQVDMGRVNRIAKQIKK
jgi:hypothetical protein